MSYEKLKMFARFPQGIPENIDIKTIKRNAVKSKPAKYDWN